MAFFLRGNYFIQFYLVHDERFCRMISLFCDDIVNWVYLFLITWMWLNLPHFLLIVSLYQCSCQVFGCCHCFVDIHLGRSWVFLDQPFAGGGAFGSVFGICHHCPTYCSLIPTDGILLPSLGCLWRTHLRQAALMYPALSLSILPSLLLPQNVSLDTYSRHIVTWMLSRRSTDQFLSNCENVTAFAVTGNGIWGKNKAWALSWPWCSKSPLMTRETMT